MKRQLRALHQGLHGFYLQDYDLLASQTSSCSYQFQPKSSADGMKLQNSFEGDK